MPGAGTHTTIIQRLAKLAQSNPEAANFLTDPDLNADWSTYGSAGALQSRYAILGAMGPDIFYMMLDYGDPEQRFEDVALKIAGTFRCVGELSSRVNNLVNSALDTLTVGVWQEIQDVFSNVKGILVDGVVDLIVDQHNLWYFFLPLRQVDDYQKNWYWADHLHYAKTGCFTQKLLDNAATQQRADPNSQAAKCLSAYALGYLTHYVADTVGHAYVNRIVESPWRNTWQRHHLVENFIDAKVWATWHDEGSPAARPGDERNLDPMATVAGDPMRNGAARLNYARLNDLCNIGSASIDPIIENAVSSICNQIERGLFDIGASSAPSLEKPVDPIFTTWAGFIADTMWQTYPPGQNHPTRMGRYPSADDVAGAYGAYRLVLSLATEDDVDKPMPPDIVGDLGSILSQMWKDITKDLGSIPPPPTPAGGQSISLESLWDSIKAGLKWLGQAADAALNTLGDVVKGLIEAGATAGADTIKAALYLLNSILYSMYHSLRMTLVMSAYSAPFTEDLMATWGPLDLSTLWNAPRDVRSPRYPIEPLVSERDLTADQSHPFSPYRPYFRPSAMAPVNVEMPATVFPSQVLAWTMPDDMLDTSVAATHDMFSKLGPAPASTSPLANPDGSKLTDLETFDGSQRYFGSIMANCGAALKFAVPYLDGTPYPQGTVLPDYNLDSDRGYAWPCWDVDWSYMNPMAPFGWNGCDPFPADTLQRLKPPASISWGSVPPDRNQVPPGLRPGLTVNDPWGSPRSGDAWVNAVALSTPGQCQYGTFPFPTIVVDPRGGLAELDVCRDKWVKAPSIPGGGLLSPDYRLAPAGFLHSNAGNPAAPQEDLIQVYLEFPYTGPTITENDGRLVDFLRAMASTQDPKLMLANAVSLFLGGGTTPLPWGNGTITSPSPIPAGAEVAIAVAQLAVTGRNAFEAFEGWTPQNADLITAFHDAFPTAALTSAQVTTAAATVLDAAYSSLWAIRSNQPAWRKARADLRWIAVSGFDDTPHRPVNVPTAPYPQYDLDVTVLLPTGATFSARTRFMIASAGTFVGPNDPSRSSFTAPAPELLLASPGQPVAGPPRTIPDDTPSIPAGNKIIIYIHGGGSRAEEAVDMANWFIIDGHAAGENYTVVSFDLPNSAYGTSFDIGEVFTPYDYKQRNVLKFEQEYIIAFIEALDVKIGGVKERIVAVMGGSLGGNMSALLTGRYDENHRYLRTIVAWSVTAAAPSTYLGIISGADVAAFLSHMQADATRPEPPDDHSIEAQYLETMYKEWLSPLLGIPPQPVTWFRGGYQDGSSQFQPCKNENIARSRFDRYEIYSPSSRHWTTAIDLEQISFSLQDGQAGLSVVTRLNTLGSPGLPGSRLLLVAGDNDNFFPNAIYNSTIDLARSLRLSGQGKAEFWLKTGHSIHSERPRLFARDILYFLAHLDAGDSPYGTVVSTPPKADYSVTNR